MASDYTQICLVPLFGQGFVGIYQTCVLDWKCRDFLDLHLCLRPKEEVWEELLLEGLFHRPEIALKYLGGELHKGPLQLEEIL